MLKEDLAYVSSKARTARYRLTLDACTTWADCQLDQLCWETKTLQPHEGRYRHRFRVPGPDAPPPADSYRLGGQLLDVFLAEAILVTRSRQDRLSMQALMQDWRAWRKARASCPLKRDWHLTQLLLEERQWTHDQTTWLGVRWATAWSE